MAPTASWGLHYWLMHLITPVAIERPRAAEGLFGEETNRRTHRRREERGDCVLFRATWYENAQALLYAAWGRRAARADPGFDTMEALAAWFRRRGIPRQVFASCKQDGGWQAANSMAGRHRKPQWIDIANPVCVGLLHGILQESRTVVLQEVLPGPDERLDLANGHGHVHELHLEASLSW